MVKICEIAQFTRATPGSSLVSYKITSPCIEAPHDKLAAHFEYAHAKSL